MAHKENTGQGTGSGVTVTTTDTTSGDQWSVATAGTGGTLQWDNAHALSGRHDRGIKNATGGTSTSAYTAWTGLSYATMFTRSYLHLTGTPSVTVVVCRGMRSSAQAFRCTVESDGKLHFRDAANGQLAVTSANVQTGTPVRVECKAVAGTSAAWSIKVWNSADSSGTPTETFSGTTGNFGSGNFDEIRFGTGASFANVAAFWGADYGVDDTAALGSAGVAPNGIAVGLALGSPALAQTFGLVPDGLAVPISLGQLVLTDGSLALAPAGLAVPVVLGSPALADGSLALAPAGLAVAVTLGSPSLADGSLALAPAGLAVALTLGGPGLSDGSMALSPGGLAVPVALGDPVLAQSFGVAPDGIALDVVLGQPSVSVDIAATPDGIAIPLALGDATITFMGGPVARRTGTPTARRTDSAVERRTAAPVARRN
jgi:hypothetical protein